MESTRFLTNFHTNQEIFSIAIDRGKRLDRYKMSRY